MKVYSTRSVKRNPLLKIGAAGLGIAFLLLLSAGIFLHSKSAHHHRQAEVASKGAQVMPFDLEKTIHRFEALPDGGLQTVTVKDPTDTVQIELIQSHLKEEAAKFASGDFSDPAAIHGNDMPGLSTLSAGYQNIDISYTALPSGASIRYATQEPSLIAAVGDWFEAQLSDHGHHAM